MKAEMHFICAYTLCVFICVFVGDAFEFYWSH